MASTPLSSGALGAGIGGALGAATGGDAGEGAMQGAGLGAAAGAMGIAPLMGKRLVIAIAQALKRQAPQAPDEQVMLQAQKLLQNPTPEVEQFIQRVMGQGGGQPPTGGMGAM